MATLTLDLFLSAGHDFESAQYRVLNGLQTARQAFQQNVIYPHLGELIQLYGTLQTVVQRLEGLRDAVPGRIKDIDPETQSVIYEKPDMKEMSHVEDLIQWAMPQFRDAIEEGRTVFEFVEENLLLEEVGLVPSYVEEGYLIVPDHLNRAHYVLQYELSIITQAGERYRSLRTTHVKTVHHQHVLPSPHTLKLDLMAERPVLPNPATYSFVTDLDFPYEETMLPVAKRKLMRYLSEQGGTA